VCLRGKALDHFVHWNQQFTGEANQKLHDVGTESIQMRRRTCTVQYSVLRWSSSVLRPLHSRVLCRHRWKLYTLSQVEIFALERAYVCMYTSLVFLYQCVSLARVILHTARPVPQNSPHFRRLFSSHSRFPSHLSCLASPLTISRTCQINRSRLLTNI